MTPDIRAAFFCALVATAVALVLLVHTQYQIFPIMSGSLLRNTLPILERAPLKVRSQISHQALFARAIPSIHSTHQQTLSTTTTHTRNFNSSASMASTKPFLEAVKERRTYYQINNKATISDDRIEELVKEAVLHVPSSFNSQSARLVVLLKKEHETFWEMVKEVLKPQVPEEQFPKTEQKLDGFKAGYGTVCTPLPIHLPLSPPRPPPTHPLNS